MLTALSAWQMADQDWLDGTLILRSTIFADLDGLFKTPVALVLNFPKITNVKVIIHKKGPVGKVNGLGQTSAKRM